MEKKNRGEIKIEGSDLLSGLSRRRYPKERENTEEDVKNYALPKLLKAIKDGITDTSLDDK